MTQQVNQERRIGSDLSDEALIEAVWWAKEKTATDLAHEGKLEMELMRRATERGATTIYGKDMKYEIKTPNEYDRSQLPALVEFLTPEQKLKCVVPAHMKEVPESHDMQQWNKAARENGGDLADGIQSLTFPGKASGKLVKTEE